MEMNTYRNNLFIDWLEWARDDKECVLKAWHKNHAQVHFEALVDMLYGKEKFSAKEMEDCLIEIGAALGVDVPEANIAVVEDPYHDKALEAMARENMLGCMQRIEEKAQEINFLAMEA